MKKSGSTHKVSNTEEQDGAALLRKVMETSGGDVEALVRKMRQRYDEARVDTPSVEIRFDDLCAETYIPEVITKGIYTVGKDLMFKTLGLVMQPVNFALQKKPPMKHVKILQHCSGIFKPGRLTLVVRALSACCLPV